MTQAPDISQWSEQRIVARNRVEKCLAQSRPYANEVVQHFSEQDCRQIAAAADDQVLDTVNKVRSRRAAEAAKNHEKNAQATFALAAVAEVARGDVSVNGLVAAISKADTVDEMAAVLQQCDDATLRSIDSRASTLRFACGIIFDARLDAAKEAQTVTAADVGSVPADVLTAAPQDAAPGQTAESPEKPSPEAGDNATEEPDATG